MGKLKMEPYKKSLKPVSRILRKNMTDAEKVLWSRIRGKQLQGLQFYRQKPLLNYIVDFYCAKAKLVIELDGGQHFNSEHQQKDRIRELALERIGLRTLRFSNLQVLTETEAVLTVINTVIKQRLS